MVDCLVALGSNRGRRDHRIARALAALGGLRATRLAAASSLYRAAPVGGPPQADFLNAAARLRTALTPMGLLIELKRIEAEAGRVPGPRWGPRPLDLDIIAYGRRRIRSRLLEIPHRRAWRRLFVIAPLAEIRPRWVPPGAREPASRRAGRLKASSENVIFWGPCPPRRR